MSLSIWNIFALGVEFSFLLVHFLCNNWYVRGIVIWPILAVIPVADNKCGKGVSGTRRPYKFLCCNIATGKMELELHVTNTPDNVRIAVPTGKR